MNKKLIEMSEVAQKNIKSIHEKLNILYHIKKDEKLDIKVDFSSNWNMVKLDYILVDESGREMIKQLIMMQVDKTIVELEAQLAKLIGYKEEEKDGGITSCCVPKAR